MSNLFIILILAAFSSQAGTIPTTISEPAQRFFETLRVTDVEQEQGEVTVVDSEGTSRTWKEGDRVLEEEATLEEVTRSHLVFKRIVQGADGDVAESLVVLRFDSSGGVKVKEYFSVSDAPRPVAPRHEEPK